MTNKLYADGKGTAYSYTPEGKLLTRTWARNITTTYSYDDCCGAMTNINYSGSTPDIAFTYDRLGRQETVEDAQGTRTFGYDPDTLALTNETIVTLNSATNVLARWQDDLGRPSGISLTLDGAATPHYTVSYAYSGNGRFCCVTSIVAGVTNVFTYSYTNNSDLIAGYVATNPASGMSFETRRIYEQNRNLITQVLNLTNGATLSQYAYGNDELGRRTNRVDSGTASATNTFLYNARSELTNAVMAANTFGFQFDPIGNRETYTTNSTTWTYGANTLNQYTNIADGSSFDLEYDSDGNLTNHNGWTFTWNGENRLITASNSSHVVSYSYDYRGRMFEKVVDGTTNHYIWDGMNIIAKLSPSQTNFNVWALDLSGSMQGAGGVGGLVATVQDGETYFTAFDANGNVCQYVDTNGATVAAREYSPFGRTTALTGSKKDDFAHWWSTKPWDTITGLSEYEYRKYSPELGRWVNRDPIEERGGVNVFLYVLNQPTSLIDVLGKQPAPTIISEAECTAKAEELVETDVYIPGPELRPDITDCVCDLKRTFVERIDIPGAPTRQCAVECRRLRRLDEGLCEFRVHRGYCGAEETEINICKGEIHCTCWKCDGSETSWIDYSVEFYREQSGGGEWWRWDPWVTEVHPCDWNCQLEVPNILPFGH